MKIKTLAMIIFFQIFAVQLQSESPEDREIFAKRREVLKKFNYFISDDLVEKFYTSEYFPNDVSVENKNIYIGMAEEKFKGEDINYYIGFRKSQTSGYDSNAKLVFYFKDDELRMITGSGSFIPEKFDHSLTGFVVRQGLVEEFSNGKLSSVSCVHKPRSITDSSKILKKQYCGDKIILNEHEEILKVEPTKEKCIYDCIFGYLVRYPGKYIVTFDDINFRDQPTLKGKKMGLLMRNEKVELLEDTGIYEYFPKSLISASWVKIKTSDGKIGYVHGSFLRAPEEPNLYEIIDKAKEWKKANGGGKLKIGWEAME